MLTDYLEHAVDPQLRSDIERHVVICCGRANYAEQMRGTIDLLAEVASGESGNGQTDELLALFRRWRDEPQERR